jgi:hypothetical protein
MGPATTLMQLEPGQATRRPADEFAAVAGQKNETPRTLSRRGIMIEPKTHTLDVPGAVLHYDVRSSESSTAPVLLLIGSPMGAAGFGTLAGHFPDRTVVTYDPRGVERSERTDDTTESTPDEHASRWSATKARSRPISPTSPLRIPPISGCRPRTTAPGTTRCSGRTSFRAPIISMTSTPSARRRPASSSPPAPNLRASWPTAPPRPWPNGSGRHRSPSPATTAASSAANTA